MMKDYVKESEFFKDEDIVNDIASVEKSKKTVIWAQEFSKRVVTIIFFVYVAMTIFSSVLVLMAMYITADSSLINTLITEVNTTFRDVVGGYIIKAAVENAFKIGGNYYVGIADGKLKAMREKLGLDKDEPIEEEFVEEETEY